MLYRVVVTWEVEGESAPRMQISYCGYDYFLAMQSYHSNKPLEKAGDWVGKKLKITFSKKLVEAGFCYE